MSEIENIRRYIERTTVNNCEKYDMSFIEASNISRLGSIEAVALAFEYGRAKGYRAAKAERRAAG